MFLKTKMAVVKLKLNNFERWKNFNGYESLGFYETIHKDEVHDLYPNSQYKEHIFSSMRVNRLHPHYYADVTYIRIGIYLKFHGSREPLLTSMSRKEFAEYGERLGQYIIKLIKEKQNENN